MIFSYNNTEYNIDIADFIISMFNSTEEFINCFRKWKPSGPISDDDIETYLREYYFDYFYEFIR